MSKKIYSQIDSDVEKIAKKEGFVKVRDGYIRLNELTTYQSSTCKCGNSKSADSRWCGECQQGYSDNW
jgi:hypothetical protein